ncbi:MAG: hypothetical protein Roseis2KO_07290 [Roseivirga sp.]
MSLDGLNDYRHQVMIARMTTLLNNHFEKKKYNKYIATPETVVERNKQKKVPDLLIWNYKKGLHHLPEVAIEVCRTNKTQEDIDKLTKLFVTVESLQEAFVFDFEENVGYRIYRKKDGKASKARKNVVRSEVFKIDLI